MPAIVTYAIAKSILFGEHAVVYGFPSIAIPLKNMRTRVVITPRILGNDDRILIKAPDLSIEKFLDQFDEENEYHKIVHLFQQNFKLKRIPPFELMITSEIPTAAGLGSSASSSVAMIKAVSQFLGLKLSRENISDYAFEIERFHHGNPSGVDNTVVTFEKPIYYQKDKNIHFLEIKKPFHLVFADSGMRSKTVEVVEQVRLRKNKQPALYQRILEDIGEITKNAKKAIIENDFARLGDLMTANHELLQKIKVSNRLIDSLVSNALENGALGAKLCGAGNGGFVIALAENDKTEEIMSAFRKTGTKNIFSSIIE